MVVDPQIMPWATSLTILGVLAVSSEPTVKTRHAMPCCMHIQVGTIHEPALSISRSLKADAELVSDILLAQISRDTASDFHMLLQAPPG